MKKEIIERFLNNQCTKEELDEVIRWVNTNALDEESVKQAFDDWKSFHENEKIVDNEKFDLLYKKIQQRIDRESISYKQFIKESSATSVFITWLTRAAAILLIPLLGFLFYTLSEKKKVSEKYASLTTDTLEIVAPIGSRTKVQLPDGTIVHLNYGSSLRYPQIFSGKTRDVILSGEGYFDVVSNPEKPFIVNTCKLKVVALGTSFNVFAYPGEKVIETTLVKGKVVLEKSMDGRNDKTIGIMKPGQHLNYNTKTGAIAVSEGNIEKYIGWKEGKLIFEDTPITEVAEKLSRMFNVNIEVSDDVKDYIYTVTLVDEPLYQILDLMVIATPVKYKAFPRKKLPDGSYSKQKIIITKRD